jgi:uncharacterized protein
VKTLEERGLDFEDAVEVSAGPTFEFADLRRGYGEQRMICYGLLKERLVVIGYVVRETSRHIFAMREATERKEKLYKEQLGES